MKIFLLNSWIYTSENQREFEDTNYTFLLYLGLRSIMCKQRELKTNYIISLDDIITELFGNQKLSTKVRHNIIGEVFYLYSIGQIKLIKVIGKRYNKWELDLSNLYFESKEHKGRFTIVDLEEVQKILKLPNKNKIAILRYYTVLVSTMINGIGNQSLSRIRNLFNVSKTMQLKYNKILEKENFIYIHRMEVYKQDINGQLKSLNNIYGLPFMKNEIDKRASSILIPLKENNKSGLIKARKNVNLLRKIRQKINKHILLTAEDIFVIISENEHQEELLRFEKDVEKRNIYMSNIIQLNFSDESMISNEEKEKFFLQLKDQIYNVGVAIVNKGEEEVLRRIVRDVLGVNKLAVDMTVKNINKAIYLYNKLLRYKERVLIA